MKCCMVLAFLICRTRCHATINGAYNNILILSIFFVDVVTLSKLTAQTTCIVGRSTEKPVGFLINFPVICLLLLSHKFITTLNTNRTLLHSLCNLQNPHDFGPLRPTGLVSSTTTFLSCQH